MRRIPVGRLLVIGWLLPASTGCVAWHTESVPPRELLQSRQEPAVRVTKPDRSRVEMWNPVLVRDSIYGNPTERAIARFSMPLSAVQGIETRRTSIGKTLLLVLGVAAGVVAYGLLQELNQGY
ncbi:MAG: hypothetical protein ACT4PM_13975 [Gemmatimonadales bacterium]